MTELREAGMLRAVRSVVSRARYKAILSPDPLKDERGNRGEYQIDHPQKVIWIDPDVSAHRIPFVAQDATDRALAEQKAAAK